MNFWSVKNVQKYYNYKSVFINCHEMLYHAALEVLRDHCLKLVFIKAKPSILANDKPLKQFCSLLYQ